MSLSSFSVKANGRPATGSTVPTRKLGTCRLDAWSAWIQHSPSESILIPKDTLPNGVMVMGKFRSGLLVLMVVWPWAAYAQAQDAPPASQGDPKVSQGRTKELDGTTAFSSSAPAPQATQGQTALPADHKSEDDRAACQNVPSDQAATQPANPECQYGGFIDAAYLLDFNHPSNHLFRSRGTAYKVDEPILNMAGAYLRKAASESSRWGWNSLSKAARIPESSVSPRPRQISQAPSGCVTLDQRMSRI